MVGAARMKVFTVSIVSLVGITHAPAFAGGTAGTARVQQSSGTKRARVVRRVWKW